MWGYGLTLVVISLIIVILAGTVLRTSLRRATVRELESQGLAIADLIGKAGLRQELWLSSDAFKRNIHNIDEITNADIYILNGKQELLYKTSDSLSLTELRSLKSLASYTFSITPVTGPSGQQLGRIILVKERASDLNIIRTTMKVILLSLLISGAIGFMVFYFIQRGIIGPLKKMRDEIDSIDTVDAELSVIDKTDEIGDLSKGFGKMLERLKESDDERKRFFQNSSHELKTPLMSIQGYAEAIKDGVVKGDEIDGALNIIIDKSKQLKDTVDKIMLLNKAENLQIDYQIELLDFDRLIDGWHRNYLDAAKKQGIAIEYVNNTEDDTTCHTDGEQLIKVLDILLDNALRYARSRIVITLEKLDSGRKAISIWNDGESIRPMDMDKIFERFYSGKDGRSGLGLAHRQVDCRRHGRPNRCGKRQGDRRLF